MTTYRYRIASRAPGQVKQGMYKGRVKADTPKKALLAALAAEFGEVDLPPFEALTITGWIEKDALQEPYSLLEDSDESFELDTGDTVFVVEVDEAKDEIAEPVQDKVPYSNSLDADEQISTEEWIATQIFDHPPCHPGSQTLRSVEISEGDAARLGRDILYSVLRRFRPDLFADNPDRSKLVLMIMRNDERYYLVDEDVLQRSLEIPRTERLAWLYGKDGDVERLTATTIHSDEEMDVSLVPDDETSGWDDYEEQLKDEEDDD